MPEFSEERDKNGREYISGSVEHVIYRNEENGYAICEFGTLKGDLITIVGTLPYIAEGEHLEIGGVWVHNPKYGRQFKVESFEKQLPGDVDSILRYLASGAVKGVGAKTAIKIVDEFGEDAFDVIEKHPDWLAQIPGISKKKALEISDNFKAESGMRSTMMFFREFFGPVTTVKIYKKWGSEAVSMAKKNPYILCDNIDGIGFEKADAMAAKLSLSPDSDARIMSGMLYMLSHNAQRNGHVCLPKDKLIEGAAQMLSVPLERADLAYHALIKQGRLKYSVLGGVTYAYSAEAYSAESFIANKLVVLDGLCPKTAYDDIERFILREEARSGIKYAPLQRRAITEALDNGVMILTGGPGTGKTTVVRALLGIFESMGMKVALAAPTGRAAKRMSEATSCEAKTVHRLLEMEYGDGEEAVFLRDERNFLDENVIIVDEASMIDNSLACALLKAVKPGARVIFIGDADQLPSVGAGNVLRDVIASGRFATVRLDVIFRQAEKSLIVTNSHAINEGRCPNLTAKDNDFFFLPRTLDTDISLTISDLCANRLPRTYGPDTVCKIQVISPSRKGEAGTDNLNIILQEKLNPASKGKKEHKHRERVFREGDRVMQTRNNYDLEWESTSRSGFGIFNGDIGTVKEIDKSEQYMLISFDEKEVVYDFSLLDDLEHAYAITVHKSQGSEYPIVIIPAYDCAPMLMTRNLLYTAVTRAEDMVIIVGREECIVKMVENNRQSMRYTGLAQRLADF
ncbi:MAG: ATP-dependent RecD-like DNA helicase [Ruminococcaceae bacterium]|nr:ATP-dependent RecD-like DNA helicase [Oscillospiraceae bacterium]